MRVCAWVVVFAAAFSAVLSLNEGRYLQGTMWAALSLSNLIEATGLGERSTAVRWAGFALVAVFFVLAMAYLFEVVPP